MITRIGIGQTTRTTRTICSISNKVRSAQRQLSSSLNPPNVVLVNHGYPPQFNAGSEVYTQTLTARLFQSKQCASVSVIAREINPFALDYSVRRTFDSHPGIPSNSLPVWLINHPREAAYHRFSNPEIDSAFRGILRGRAFGAQSQARSESPLVVHFGHLNHLSTQLPAIAKSEFGAKTVYTLHDFWLHCPRYDYSYYIPHIIPYRSYRSGMTQLNSTSSEWMLCCCAVVNLS